MDYSPEIDTFLLVISVPTFKGHCGCFLFDLNEIKHVEGSEEGILERLKKGQKLIYG